MKKQYYYLMKGIMILSLCFATGIAIMMREKRNAIIPDPESAITVNLKNTKGNNQNNHRNSIVFYENNDIYIQDNNFYSSRVCIANVGKVNSLGSITAIPNDEFVNFCAVKPGYGYVLKCENGTYARLYVIESFINIYGDITDIKVKYQYPFEP